MAKDVSVEIGLTGGGSTAVAIPEEQIQAFKDALKDSREPWYTITSADGAEFHVDITKVVFVRIAAVSRGIGFHPA
jgi:hypothetical protein